jgi:Type I restriction modification DNA specificity domain
MSDAGTQPLSYYEREGEIELGRGEVISSIDLATFPGDYPVYSSSAVGAGEFGRYGRFMFDEELITWSIDGGGRPFYRPKHRYSVTNVCGYLRIKRSDLWNYRYLHALLERLQSGIQFDYQMKAHPSVIRGLYQFNRVSIQEQEMVGKILDTLDTAIRETEAIIAKLKAVKQGLLHDLLSRGIDANGELRPPQSEAPHLYKPSSLGWVPKEWDEITLGEIVMRSGGLLQTGPFGSQLHAHEYSIEGVPVVMPQDMLGEELSLDNIARITEQKAITLTRHRMKQNDLVFSRRGDYRVVSRLMSGASDGCAAQDVYWHGCRDMKSTATGLHSFIGNPRRRRRSWGGRLGRPW